MNKPLLVRYELVREGPGVWVLSFGHDEDGERITLLRSECGERKTAFVKRCAEHCCFQASPARPISLRIHAVNGRFLEERTYPKSADPRRSKG